MGRVPGGLGLAWLKNTGCQCANESWYSGPGISSMMGLFLQAGPCSILDGDNKTHFNPYSWTEFAHMIFIELVMTQLTRHLGWSLTDNTNQATRPALGSRHPQRTVQTTWRTQPAT